LGPRGWHRPRRRSDPRPSFDNFPKLPVETAALTAVAEQLHSSEEEGFRLESFQRSLNEEIGYSVVRRPTVALVFGGFLLAGLGLGVASRWSRRPELLGWLGPAAALAATAVFVVLGETSRRAVPATVAVAQVVEMVPDSSEAAVRGRLAVYRPN